MKQLTHLATRVFGTPLLIRPSKLAVILNVIGPRIGLSEGAIQVQGLFDPDDEDDAAQTAEQRAPYAVTPDGIACIGIEGTLVKKAGWLDAMSGMMGYDSIAMQLRMACNDNAIRGIMLCLDTPGGEVSGLYDLTDEIYNARAVKPVYAISDDSAFSAGYAIACSAEKVFVTRTGGVGSIGVIAVHVDQSKMDEKVGLKYTAVYAGAHKNDFSSHAPLSEEAHALLKAEIDRCYDMFVDTVARGRNMKDNAIRKTEAKCFWGAEALAVGLADQVGNCDDALDAMRSAIKAKSQARVPASAVAQIPKGEMTMNPTETTADATTQAPAATTPAPPAQAAAPAPAAPAPATPAATAPVAPVAVAPDALAARQAELEEIEALCSLTGHPDMLGEAIKSKMSYADVRKALTAKKSASQAGTPLSSATAGTALGADHQLNQAAQQLATAKGITFAQAYVQTLNQNPALYKQYLAEKRTVATNSGQ